jgi:hypothetical protein
MSFVPFTSIDWDQIQREEHKGEKGTAYWQSIQFDNFRARIVEYSKGYLADHWCRKGHIVYCIEGSFISLLDNGEEFHLHKGMSYVVTDNASNHRSISPEGVKLLIIDGDFLKG